LKVYRIRHESVVVFVLPLGKPSGRPSQLFFATRSPTSLLVYELLFGPLLFSEIMDAETFAKLAKETEVLRQFDDWEKTLEALVSDTTEGGASLRIGRFCGWVV